MNSQIKLLNVVLLGNATVGKSSIFQQLVYNKFSNETRSTIGASLSTFCNDLYNLKLSIWDTAGQERFDSLIPSYLRRANIIIFVINLFEYSNQKKNNLDYNKTIYKYFNMIKEQTFGENVPKILILLNKCDLVDPLEYCDLLYDIKTCCFSLIFDSFTNDSFIIVSAKKNIGFKSILVQLSLYSELIHSELEDLNYEQMITSVNKGLNKDDKTNCCY